MRLSPQLAKDVADAVEFRALVEEMVRAGRHAGASVLRVGVIGQHHEDDAGHLRMNRAEHVDAGAADELIVQQHACGPGGQNARDRFRGRTRIANHRNVRKRANQLAQPFAH